MGTWGIARGYAVAAVGGLLLVAAVVFLDWYSVGEGKLAPSRLTIDATLLAQAPQIDPEVLESFSRENVPDSFGPWESEGFLGAVANLVMLAAGAAGIGAGLAAAIGGRIALPPPALAGLGALAALLVALRMIFPVEEIGDVAFEAGLEPGIFIALAGALLILVGGLLAVREAGPRPTAG